MKRLVSEIGSDGRNLINSFDSFDDFSESRVAAVKMRRVLVHDEELGRS